MELNFSEVDNSNAEKYWGETVCGYLGQVRDRAFAEGARRRMWRLGPRWKCRPLP